MGRRLGIYTLGHYLSLKKFFAKKIWNPLLEDFETWELSVLDSSGEDDRATLGQTLDGMSETYLQVLHGFFPLPERIAALERIHQEYSKNINNLAAVMSMEVQKPIKLAMGECERGLDTIQAAIDWGKKLQQPGARREAKGRGNFSGWTEPLPRGLVLGSTPFNFPFNLCLHKIAPALLAGCPLLWRPSAKCQLTNLALVDVIHAAKIPAGMLAFLPMTHETYWSLLQDPRISCVSFTGSEAVGWQVQQKYRGPIVLELGGSAPIYVEKLAGDELQAAIKEIAASAYSFGGQSCISAQNLLVADEIYDEAVRMIKQATDDFAVGKPNDEKALTSGVIDEEAFTRINRAIADAEKSGAQIFRSKQKSDTSNFIAPTLIFNPPKELQTKEVFAPVLNVLRVKDVGEFIAFANALPHRLQAAIYSSDKKNLERARLELDFGGVALNAASSVRVDSLPYGGRALAGMGAEDPQSTWTFLSPLKTFYEPQKRI